MNFNLKDAFRLDAKQREAKVGDLREWSITSLAKIANLRESSRVVANLRDWSLHRLILILFLKCIPWAESFVYFIIEALL